jgi:hypothetical protein
MLLGCFKAVSIGGGHIQERAHSCNHLTSGSKAWTIRVWKTSKRTTTTMKTRIPAILPTKP